MILQVAFSVEPFQSPGGIFTPAVELPSASHVRAVSDPKPVSIITSELVSSSRRIISSPSAVRGPLDERRRHRAFGRLR